MKTFLVLFRGRNIRTEATLKKLFSQVIIRVKIGHNCLRSDKWVNVKDFDVEVGLEHAMLEKFKHRFFSYGYSTAHTIPDKLN